MTYLRKAAKSGVWFAGFKFLTQAFSWIITIYIARLLSPEDYGLMSMANILTGYILIFSELGLGSAIIQKKDISPEELSSLFWIMTGIGILFATISYVLSYPTAWIFNEPRVIPITKLISILFVISSISIVPDSILTREVRFKEIGMIQLLSVILSCISMLWMASRGFAVWTLIYGTIILRTANTILVYWAAKWRPKLHFDIREIGSLIKFGVNVAGARSLNYIFQKSDQFIVGKIFSPVILGYYSFAMQLASIPTDKIVSIVGQVSYPVFARYQDEPSRCRELYLETIKYIVFIVAPLFMGGFFFGDRIVLVFLGEKWAPIIPMFRFFCIAQFFLSLSALNGIIHNAMGRPRWNMIYIFISILVMPVSIYIAAIEGFNYVPIPWIAIYPILCMGWIWITLKKLNISLLKYLSNIITPLLLTGVTVLVMIISKYIFSIVNIFSSGNIVILCQELVIGAVCYVFLLFIFERQSLIKLASLRK